MGSLENHGGDSPEPEDRPTADRNRRIGLLLFLIYAAVYTGFVLLNAFKPQWSEWTPWRGINLAVIYGMLLIAGAFALALLYGWLCRKPASPSTGEK